jgi:hypothetical protein
MIATGNGSELRNSGLMRTTGRFYDRLSDALKTPLKAHYFLGHALVRRPLERSRLGIAATMLRWKP